MYETLADRFWSKVAIRGLDECWLWSGMRVTDGMRYGRIFVEGKTYDYAHRVAFFLQHGRWPAPGLVVLHSCDNPICMNPAHLSEGTQASNVLDAKAKGRTAIGDRNAMRRPEIRAKVQGERNPSAKLSDAAAAELKHLVKSKQITQGEAHRRYGVSRSLVCMIVSGKRRP